MEITFTVDRQVILLQFESNGTGIYSTTDEGELVSFPFKWTWGTNEETLNMYLTRKIHEFPTIKQYQHLWVHYHSPNLGIAKSGFPALLPFAHRTFI